MGNMYILGKFQLSEVNYPSVSDFYDNWDRPPNYKLFACPTKNFIHIRFRSIRAAFTRTDGQTTIWIASTDDKWRRLTRHSSAIRTYQSGSEPGINCSKRYSNINLVVVTRHSGGVHCSLMCCMTPGGPCDLQPHVEGGPVSHTTGDVTWRSSAPWRIRQWGKTVRRSCKPYVLSLLRQVWLLGYHCAHHENNLFCRNKWSLGRSVSFVRQYANDCFLTLYSPVVIICTNSVTFNDSTFCPHSIFMCFMWIWEQTAIISLYSINWLVFITETECVYCAVRTGSLYIFLRSAHTVYLCVLCGSENKQRLFPYTALTDWFL